MGLSCSPIPDLVFVLTDYAVGDVGRNKRRYQSIGLNEGLLPPMTPTLCPTWGKQPLTTMSCCTGHVA